ncbi:MAG: hypothetical protein QXR83_09320 [Archaeoglobaceae archaeon]
MSGLCILGFDVKVEVGNLQKINPGEMTILEIRQKLNSRKIPNTVVEDSIIAASENSSELQKLGLSFHVIDLDGIRKPTLIQYLSEIKEDIFSRWPLLVARLASSAVGIYLREMGMLRSSTKFYRDEGAPLGGGEVYKHEAFIVSVHRLENSYILTVDPCYKLEAYEPLSRLGSSVEKIGLVKVRGRGSSYSFELLEIVEKPSREQLEKAEKVARALSSLDSSLTVHVRESSSIAKVTPCSYRLRKHLEERALAERDPDSYMSYTFLPCELLYPVASLDQLKVLGVDTSNAKLWMKPSERYEKALELAKKIGSRIKVGSVRVEIVSEEPVSVRSSFEVDYRASIKDSLGGSRNVRPRDVASRDLWKEITPLKKGSKPKVAIACTNSKVSDEILKAFKKGLTDNLSRITEGQAEVELLKSGEAVLKLEDIIEEIPGFNAVVLVGKGDDEEYARFEYALSEKRIVPQYVNGQEFTNITEESSRKYKHAPFPIAKSIAWRLGWRYVKIEAPAQLADAVVVGIDRTYVRTGKGVSLAVAAVLQSADGLTIHHLPPKLVENEEEAVLRVAYDLKQSITEGGPVIFCLNRSFIQEKLFANLRNSFGEPLIVAGVSKTHSMSRLLKKTREGTANPQLGTCAVLEESGQYGRFLVASSHTGRDRTIRPALASIRVAGAKVRARDVLNYIFSTQALCIEAPYYVASMPWPLHRAHNLCEKISRIARITRNIPQSLDLL